MDKRKIMENLLALANDKCNKFASAAAYAKYLKMKAELDGKQTSESTEDQTEYVMVDDEEEWNIWKHSSNNEFTKYFNTIYAVEGGYLIRRSTFLDRMWSHFVSQLRTFGNEYPGVYKNCMKQIRFYVQLQVDEFECDTWDYNWEGVTCPTAWNGNNELLGNPKTNYLMFLTADEYSVIKENHDNVVDGIRSDVEEKDKNRKK